MLLRYTIETSFRGLRTNKTRSLLTILGIVIGITAIIMIVSVGRGAQNLILNEIQGLGSRTIAVIPGREPKGPSDAAQIFSQSLKPQDLKALENKANAPDIRKVLPVVFGGESASYRNESYRLTVFGTAPEFSSVFDLIPEVGTFFTSEEVQSRGDVAVIGAKVKKELFGESDAIGKKIKIKNRSLRIIGVLPQKGQVSFFNFDEIAIMPYTTAQQYIFGIKYFHRFIVEADSDLTVENAASDIRITLRNSHGITDPSKDDFFVQTQADLAKRLGTITSALTLFLVLVASVSLFVGGVGIMNIMLVSVTERTREIGLRKALGATRGDILRQFLLEAVLLTGTGGVIGIVIGTMLSLTASLLISRFAGLNFKFSFPFGAAILGFAVSALIGLLFGIYPARKAANKSPMEALRYE